MQTPDSIVSLLDDVKHIEQQKREKMDKHGKNFNIFYVQGTASDEVRICRLIRELLDPEGSHGQGSFFLRMFMERVLKQTDYFSDEEYSRACISRELVIAAGRRIDIVIRIGNRLFPIEVKIYASDQESQCFDYYKYAVAEDSSAKVYYLTLYGQEPSSESKGSLLPGQFECLSFADDILKWLDECVNSPTLKGANRIKDVLTQFMDVVCDLTGRPRGKMAGEIMKIIASSEDNMKAAVNISKALVETEIAKMKEVFSCIMHHMTRLGFDEIQDYYIRESDAYYRLGHKSYPKIDVILPVAELEGKVALCFQIGESYLYYGIRWSEKCNREGGQDHRIEEYVMNYLFPRKKSVETGDKKWFWWKYVQETGKVNFRNLNEEYFSLFDKDGFESFLNEVYSAIDEVLKDIKNHLDQEKRVCLPRTKSLSFQ